MNPACCPECVPLLGPLHGSKCLPAATQIPSPPLEERARERRPLLSTYKRDGLEEYPDGRDLGTVIAKNNRGLLSPAHSSRGGEGEAAAHQAGGYANWNVERLRAKNSVRIVLFVATRVKSEGRRSKAERRPKPESPSASRFRSSYFGLQSYSRVTSTKHAKRR
jgi:hypothetical protein